MTSNLHAALLAGSAVLTLVVGTISVRADDGLILRAVQQHAAMLDDAEDLDDMASTSRSAVSDTAANWLEDRDAPEIIDVLMSALGAATEE